LVWQRARAKPAAVENALSALENIEFLLGAFPFDL
jgi:hypothetical protein